MCGIALILAREVRPLDEIFAMTDSLVHRGPDDAGHLIAEPSAPRELARSDGGASAAGRIALGHRRLSIIDTSERSVQPMTSADGRHTLIFNGEIYNYRELARELSSEGLRLRTSSDTEVLLEALARWGQAAIPRLNGIWAFAFVDWHERSVLLCRDRFGVKPLHYVERDSGLYVASEPKALFAAAGRRPTANYVALADHVVNAAADRDESSAFADVRSLPAGHLVRHGFDRDRLDAPTRYWSLDDGVAAAASRVDGSFARAVDSVDELFTRAIELQMRSDVPVGGLLSGGIDSSLICAQAKRQGGQGVRFEAFTAGNTEGRFDESAWAGRVASHVGLPHAVTVPAAEGFIADFDSLTWHQDEPVTGTSLYSQHVVMREARRAGTTVLLDGQGADEIFCGYKKYFPVWIRSLLRAGRWAEASRVAGQFARHGDRGFLRVADARRYLPRSLQRHYPGFDALARGRAILEGRASQPLVGATVGATQRLDLERNSVPVLLRVEDRNSMAFSIESRVPYLDHELVALAMALPVECKLRGGVTKSVLREVARRRLPAAVVDRRNKMNFNAPLSSWMRSGLRPVAHEAVRSSAILPRLVDVDALLDLHGRRAGRSGPSLDALVFRCAAVAVWERVFDVRA